MTSKGLIPSHAFATTATAFMVMLSGPVVTTSEPTANLLRQQLPPLSDKL
jgi:hypothetical protein